MGLYEQIQSKTTRYPDAGAVMEHVLKGKGKEIGFGPVTEILLHRDKGLKPGRAAARRHPELHGVRCGADDRRRERRACADLRAFLGSADTKGAFVAAGVE